VAPIDVKPAWTYWFVLGVFVSMAFTMAGIALRSFATAPTAAAAQLGAAALLGLLPVVWARGRRNWARRIDVAGVTRTDGRIFPWAGLVRVEANSGRGGVVSYDLIFEEGKVRVPLALGHPPGPIREAAESLHAGSNPFGPRAR
jgi:hypothetical protein